MIGQNQNLYFIHWNEDEAQELADTLPEHAWNVTVHHSSNQFKMGELCQDPPAALVISLQRLPSHGREIADAVWSSKWGREIPIIFFNGHPEKLPALQEKFPGAIFTAWEALISILDDL
jgi:hypothetical protein